MHKRKNAWSKSSAKDYLRLCFSDHRFCFDCPFAENIAAVFTHEPLVVETTADVLTWVFLSTPIVGIQLIGSAYFQAIGKAIPALLLTLTRQGFSFIPFLLVLPRYYGSFGVWISFPIAEFISTLVTAFSCKGGEEIYRKDISFSAASFFVLLK